MSDQPHDNDHARHGPHKAMPIAPPVPAAKHVPMRRERLVKLDRGMWVAPEIVVGINHLDGDHGAVFVLILGEDQHSTKALRIATEPGHAAERADEIEALISARPRKAMP